MAGAQKMPIAIIGMSCRTAGADSPSELWDALASSKDVQSRTERFNSAGFYKPDGAKKKGLMNVDRGYFMQGDVGRFDNAFFSIPPMEAVAMDPQQRMLLELTYEAMENAGLPLDKFMGTNTAVYTGMTWNDYAISLFRDVDMTPTYMSTGACNAIAANRVSYFFDLHGPSLVLDTACSSTMYALHQAVSALQSNESEMAIVNGSNLILNPDILVCMSEMDFLSPTGRCRTFDANGDGYVRAEGTLALLLKPLDKAIADGDPVRSIIRGTQVNQDGRTQGLTLPSAKAQTLNMKALYEKCGIDPAEVQYFEAHGTGTAAGDPLEMSAIEQVYGPSHTEQKLIVGSVKSNIGHLEAAAALAGIVKTVQALEKGEIPPQMHFVNPNPKIDFSHVQVPTNLMAWPATKDGIRRAAINSFGFGGSNGHTVLEYHTQDDTVSGYERPFLFKISAAGDASLNELVDRYSKYAVEKNPALIDLAHTLLARRSTHKKSAFVAASTTDELVKKLSEGDYKVRSKGTSSPKNIAFVFTGQGAQWASMGKQLIDMSPLFRSIVQQCDEVLQSLPDGPAWNAQEELCKPKETSRIYESSLSQPLCTVLQIGLVELWRSWGVRPAAVVGHSSGEIGAAYCSGSLSLRDCVVIAYYRGLYLGSGSTEKPAGPKGSMCAVGLGEKDARSLVKMYPDRLALAAINSPGSCTISGDEDAILEVVEGCKASSTFCRQLRVDMAYHSHHMLPLAPKYEDAMIKAGVAPAHSKTDERACRMFSSVRGKEVDSNTCSPAYWKENMTSTVSFTAAVTEMARHVAIDAVVELGPHPALKGPVEDTLASLGTSELPYFSSCSRGKPDFVSLLESASSMLLTGLDLSMENINAFEVIESPTVTHKHGKVLTDLPGYAWDHSRSFWAETRMAENYRHREYPRHDLLGSRKTTDNPLSMSWRSLISRKDAKWLADWTVQDHAAALPWSLYVLMATEAARQASIEANQVLRIEGFRIHEDYLLSNFASEETVVEFHFNLHRTTTQQKYSFNIQAGLSKRGTEWTELCSGIMNLNPQRERQEGAHAGIHDEKSLKYAQSFPLPGVSGIVDLKFNNTESAGTLEDSLDGSSPLALDSVLRLPTLMFLNSPVPSRYRLDSIDFIEISLDSTADTQSFSITTNKPVNGIAYAETLIQADGGNVCLSISGAKYTAEESLRREPALESLFFERKILPDVAYARTLEDMSLANLIELVTHKWPMCDIAIDCSDNAAIPETIVSHLQGVNQFDRPRFRSVTVVGQPFSTTSARIQTVDSLDSDSKYHAIFTMSSCFDKNKTLLNPSGIVCLLDTAENLPEHDFQRICSVLGQDENTWVVGRPAPQLTRSNASMLKILSSSSVLPSGFEVQGSQMLDLAVEKTDTIGQELSSEACDAIILDLGSKSMLTERSGDDLLPWLQKLLTQAQTLLWVSLSSTEQPFGGVDGAFIRTLCAENPGLRAASIAVQDEITGSELSNLCSSIYDSIKQGDNEIELCVRNGVVHSLRYIPDDELSASVGLAPPTQHRKPVDFDYRISCEGKGRVELYTVPIISESSPTSAQVVQVGVEVSLIGLEDQLKIRGVEPFARSELGSFFIGKTLEPTDDGTKPPGRRVFGWSTGAHASKVQVQTSQVISLDHDIQDLSQALNALASYTTATCLLDYEGRVREDDTIRAARLPQTLLQAVALVASHRGAVVAAPLDSAGDFDIFHDVIDVSYDSEKGITLNGRLVSLESVFEKHSLASILKGQWSQSPLQLPSKTHSFSVQDFAGAFDFSISNPHSAVVLRHTDGIESVENALVAPAPEATLFRGDGAYIILGGLGGLGQYLSAWMVQNGARHIVTLSRNGSSASGAKELTDEITRLGAKIDILRADASQIDQLERALEEVRAGTKIRGCINMAMVLEDRPLTSMTAVEWDRSLQAKIPTSWNLHNATIGDELDFFLLFSSVVSMTGNRMQSNYAVGNVFQNRLAAYRRSLGLTAVSLAVPSMYGIGVLSNNESLLEYFDKAGLAPAGPEELPLFVKAAVHESRRPSGRSFIGMGLQMFKTLDGKIQARPSQTQMFWTEFPEFGFLMDHQLSGNSGASDEPLPEQLKKASEEAGLKLLMQSFLQSLANILGYKVEAFDTQSSIAAYGLDSLNAVACRYWFFKEIGVDVPVFDILGCKSIQELVSRVLAKLKAEAAGLNNAVVIPDPVRLEASARRPLSYSQQRLWFLHKFLADKTVYNLLLVCHIEGVVNSSLLQQTWEVLLQRHDVLRTHFVDTPDGLQQIPVDDLTFGLETIELTDDKQFSAKVAELTEVAKSYKFDLDRGELVRCWLLKSPSRTRLFLGSHHLAWDRTSTGVVFDEITTIYKSLLRGEPPETNLEPAAFQFVDYAAWQAKCINTDGFREPLVEYWQTQLLGIPEAVSLLPMAHSDRRPAVKQLSTRSLKLQLDASVGISIKEFCAANAITPFMFMTSAISALISRLTGDEDIVVGIADGDRGHSSFDRLIGFAVNMLPIRSKTTSDMPFLEHLENFRQTCLSAYEHRELPFDYLLQKIDVPRNAAHNPVFQIVVNYVVHGSFKEADFGAFKFSKYDHYNARTQTDFGLDIEETSDGSLDCTFEFDTSIYDEAGLSELSAMYQQLIMDVIEGGGKMSLQDIKLASPQDEARISCMLQPAWDLEVVQACRESLFSTLFERSVNLYPNKTAVADELQSLSYAEVDRLANAVANTLISGGARTGDAVGMYCESGVDMAIAIYGIWKAGCAFVAIQDVPEERLRFMVEDVDMERVIVDSTGDGSRVHDMIAAGLKSRHVYKVDDMRAGEAALTEAPKLSRPVEPDDPLCCIFTSGSTGRPKGVFLSHIQVRLWQHGYYEKIVGATSHDKLLLASVPTFDMSLVSLYGAPVYGGTLVVASREARYSPAMMTDLVVDHNITGLMITPSQLAALLTAKNANKLRDWIGLRDLALGGEPVSSKLARDFYALGLPQARLWNVYGPSEATITVSVKEVSVGNEAARLASPQFPSSLYIVDEQGRPVPFGVPGELFIGGPGVSKGYIKRPDLTEAAFMPDQSVTGPGLDSVSPRRYRTGDQFVLHRDGTLSIKGRINGDRQVKIRGMRTELGEIETAIWSALDETLPTFTSTVNISSVAVVYRKKEELIAAYLVPGDAVDLDSSMRELLAKSLRYSLQAVLPAHMRPGAYTFLDEMPSSTAGKTNYQVLLGLPTPKKDSDTETRVANGLPSELSDLQADIADVWTHVLDIDRSIAPADDFFSVGGHSLALVNIQDEIEERYGVTVSLADMFAQPSLEAMEMLVLNALASTSQPNGTATTKLSNDAQVDWISEATLPAGIDRIVEHTPASPPSVVALTGASSMIGIHLLHHLLATTSMEIVCLAESGESEEDGFAGIVSALQRYQLAKTLSEDARSRLQVFPGKLSHPTLGLSEQDIQFLDSKVHAIYHLASDVSLIGNADKVRAGNLGVVQFLIGLAQGLQMSKTPNVKSLHFLSTWGVPHLQTWHDTQITGNETVPGRVVNGSGPGGDHVRRAEESLAHIVPGGSSRLAYLKVRWASEMLLERAAERGLPVSIFRPSMTAPALAVGLPRDDINRRIVEASLQTGLVPEFEGGMGWLTADFLAAAITHLSLRQDSGEGGSDTADATAKIWHLVPEHQDFYDYANLDKLLQTSHDGKQLRVVDPPQWFAALRASGNVEMVMQAAVLEEWWTAGWVPFEMDATKTRDVLYKEAGLRPRAVDREMILNNVVGQTGF